MSQKYETFGNYILLEKLASGGMAEVYLAKKLAASGVQKFVAVKRILSQFSDSQDFIQMFKDEAKIAININHSNVVSIYDFGIQKNQFYIVMEFVEGRNMRQILNRLKKKGKHLSVSQIVHVIAEVSAGLDNAHRCIDPTTGQPLNIIHRDMSPQNVMLSFDGAAKIVDFGIAKAETQMEATRAGTLKGKFGYMSPEQVEGQIIDSRTDIFAIGIMTWEMLAGQRLFLSTSELNTLRNIRDCKVPSLREINPNIPVELDQIVLKALKKDKSQRYQTCAELNRDLLGFLSRFEPDFSVQDFSAFIKGFYSQEIIETRKKQIMFAQINVAAQHQDFSEKTEIITQTESEVAPSITFEDMSLNTLTNNRKPSVGTQSRIRRRASQMDFSKAVLDNSPSQAQQPQLRQSQSRQAAKRPKSFSLASSRTFQTPRSKSSSPFISILLFLSILFGAVAYVIRYEPDLQAQVCDALNTYEICESIQLAGREPSTTTKPVEFFEVVTNPPGANVYIDGIKKGRSPYPVPKRAFPIRISARYIGYRVGSTEVLDLPRSGKAKVELKRTPTGFVKILAAGAEVYIDELKVEKNEQVNIPANEPVTITVINPINGLRKDHVVTVEKGQTQTLVFTPPTGN